MPSRTKDGGQTSRGGFGVLSAFAGFEGAGAFDRGVEVYVHQIRQNEVFLD